MGGTACSTVGTQSFDGGTPAVGTDTAPTQTALQQMLAATPSSPAQAQLLQFYAARNFAPVWTGNVQARARAASVVFTLMHAGRQGLNSADYPVDADRAEARPQPGKNAALYDVTLTASLLRYAHDVRLGRVDPHAVYKDVLLPARNFDAAAALTEALKQDRIDTFLDDLPPPEAGYRGLVAALAHYRAIATHGGWPRIAGKTVARAKLLKRLQAEDAHLAKIAHPSNAEIKKAIVRFQARNGLDTNGDLGSTTLAALNLPISKRIEEIAANMERWRWLPRQLEAAYIRVDVPDQSVDFVRDGKPVLHSSAIIGRNDNRTPILRTTVQAVIVNPPWDIPDDIAAKAILPHLRRDAHYLAKRHMVLVDAPKDDPRGAKINWRKVKADDLPYQIREEPGPKNVLGKVMLDMPNDFDVYLHGTPNAHLYEQSDRERSHGCVRVEKILDLALLSLSASLPDAKATLEKDIAGGTTQRLALAQPLPVYLLYWTARANEDGEVEFRPDRYDRDPPLIAKLKG